MLYHKDIGLPDCAKKLYGKSFRLVYSEHAKRACVTDKYGYIMKPPFEVTVTPENLIEVESDLLQVAKFVIRQKYDSKFDVVLAISADLVVKTIWLNESNDLHFTLDTKKYVDIRANV